MQTREAGQQQTRTAAVVLALTAAAAIWRAVLAAQHQWAALEILDDPSARELEQVAALVEAALALILLAHAAAAAFYLRRPLVLSGPAALLTGLIAFATVGGSLFQVPLLGAAGVVPLALVLTCAAVGYRVRGAWFSTYLGAACGSLVGGLLGGAGAEPFALLAVVVPAVVFALVGVASGRGLRRVRGADR